MKIICGTDFTAHAAIGANVAAVLAEKLKDSLLLVHALPTELYGEMSLEVMDSVYARLQEKLEEEAARLGQFGADVEPQLVTGSPDRALVGKVVASETRLVVVSSQGRRGPNQWVRGGMCERVAERAPVPTLVVRNAEPLMDWLHGQRPLKVMCAYDYTATSNAAVAYLKEFRRFGPCDLVVAQVDALPDEKARLGIPGPVPIDANEPEVQRILERELKEKISGILGEEGTHICVKGAWGRPHCELIEMANRENADLIVVGAHQWRGMKRLIHMSVSRALLRHAPMNLLVVPPAPGMAENRLPQLSRVLVAVDFSDVSREAVLNGCALLRPGGVLHLLHVLPPGGSSHGAVKTTPGPLVSGTPQADHLKRCAERLRTLIPAEAETRNLIAEVEVSEHPEPATAICQAAERFGADVLCLGTHGHSGWSAMLGSVTQAVLRLSSRPLFIVHPPPP